MMHIGLGIEALSPQLTGIGRYTWELAKRLPSIPEIDSLKLFRENTWFSSGDDFLQSVRPTRRMPKMVDRWISRREFSRRLYHGPNFFYPHQTDNAVITVHDLSVFRFPETHPIERIQQFEREFVRSITGARHIITDTNYIKQELVDMFGVSPIRVTAVPLGVSDDFFESGHALADHAFLVRHGLEAGGYGLCVATIEPRKGLDHALSAFQLYIQRTKRDTKLVIVGASGWNNSHLHDRFAEASSAEYMKFLGFVSDEALRSLYRNCGLFIYPSLYEGFGLPVIEAMACRVPILISDRSCLPEVSGGTAMMVDVEDHESFSFAIQRGLEDDKWRSRAAIDGMSLARKYSWDQCATRTAEIYRSLVD